jgi:hypothetical protein
LVNHRLLPQNKCTETAHNNAQCAPVAHKSKHNNAHKHKQQRTMAGHQHELSSRQGLTSTTWCARPCGQGASLVRHQGEQELSAWDSH